jgi:WD repeat-containing protein 1 (actin-interacting protein 1)
VAKFSPNGFWVASADTSGKVRVWAWDNPAHLTKLETQVFAGSVLDLDWDMESKKIVAAGEGSGILVKAFLWDTGNSVGEMVGHTKRILSVAYKPTRPFKIMTASEDSKTIFYAGPPFKLAHSNAEHTNFVTCVRYSPDGNRVASVSSDKKIQLYDGTTGLPNGAIVDGHAGSIYSVCFSPDSTKFITASADKTVKLWNAATLALEQTFSFTADPQLGDMQVSVLWMQNYILSVSLNGNINVLDLDNPSKPKKVIYAHQVAITGMCLDAHKTLYTGSFDGVVCAHNLNYEGISSTKVAGVDKKTLCSYAHNGKVAGLAVNTAGDLLSIGWDDTVRFADVNAHAYTANAHSLAKQPCAIATGSKSGLTVVVTNATIELFRGTSHLSSTPAPFQPTCVSISVCEGEIAVGCQDSKTRIFKVTDSTVSEIAAIETRTAVSCVAYSPLGDVLAIGDAGRQIEVYVRGTWAAEIKGKWVFHTSKVNCLCWSPSGAFLLSGSQDESLIVWSRAVPGKKLQLSYAHMGGVTGVAFLSEDRLVSVGSDHVIATWKIPLTPESAEWK